MLDRTSCNHCSVSYAVSVSVSVPVLNKLISKLETVHATLNFLV